MNSQTSNASTSPLGLDLSSTKYPLTPKYVVRSGELHSYDPVLFLTSNREVYDKPTDTCSSDALSSIVYYIALAILDPYAFAIDPAFYYTNKTMEDIRKNSLDKSQHGIFGRTMSRFEADLSVEEFMDLNYSSVYVNGLDSKLWSFYWEFAFFDKMQSLGMLNPSSPHHIDILHQIHRFTTHYAVVTSPVSLKICGKTVYYEMIDRDFKYILDGSDCGFREMVANEIFPQNW